MSNAPWIKPLRQALCAALLAGAAIGVAGNTAWAQSKDDDDDVEDHILNADKRMLNAILGTIGLGSDTPSITYRERSPLVVPQGRDLPPPGKAVRAPDWPVEPEVKEKRKAAAAGKNSKRERVDNDVAAPISGTRENWKTGNTGAWTEEKKAGKEPSFFNMLLEGKLGGTWEEYGNFTGEPPRTSLVQPPSGYMTPSPAAPYGTRPRADAPEKKEPKL